MKKKILSLLYVIAIVILMVCGCGEKEKKSNVDSKFSGDKLSILVSVGWMEERYDETIKRFEEAYDVTVDVQTIPADQYNDILQTKLASDTCSDIFWIQSDPYAIETTIVDYENKLMDFTGATWQKKIPQQRLSVGMVGDKLYGLHIWSNSPESVIIYNKTLFEELGIEETPKTYDELLSVCEIIAKEGITPWFMPGADGWQHQLAFFQIGGLYEETTPGLYEDLNTNNATFANNEKMLEVLEQFKELSSKGYFGEDWIGTDSTSMTNEFGDRNIAMCMGNGGTIKRIKDETGTEDEFGLFINPLGDNDTLPFNPAGPTMFGYKNAKNPELVREFFNFVCTTDSLQEILDNSIDVTNLQVNDDNVEQHWSQAEKDLLDSVPKEKGVIPALQVGTKYTNTYWMDFGADMVAYCLDTMEANDVLENMDKNRATSAKVAEDTNWN